MGQLLKHHYFEGLVGHKVIENYEKERNNC